MSATRGKIYLPPASAEDVGELGLGQGVELGAEARKVVGVTKLSHRRDHDPRAILQHIDVNQSSDFMIAAHPNRMDGWLNLAERFEILGYWNDPFSCRMALEHKARSL